MDDPGSISAENREILHADTFSVRQKLLAIEYRPPLALLSVCLGTSSDLPLPPTIITVITTTIIIALTITNNHTVNWLSFLLRIVRISIPDFDPDTRCNLSY